MELAGSTFIVTGGASGLGAATVRSVVAAAATPSSPTSRKRKDRRSRRSLARRCASCARRHRRGEREGGGAAAVDGFGGLQGLVNCAGIVYGEKVVGKEGPHSLAGFARTININLIGTFNMLRLAAAAMTANAPNADGERGVIVNTSSIAAFDGQIGQAAYSASKAGVAGMTLPMARELARHGIRVMTIAPGNLRDADGRAGAEGDRRRAGERWCPSRRVSGGPAEFASLVVEIVRNVMLNGEVIRLDGAIRMAPK